MGFLHYQFLNNTVINWLVAVVAFVVILSVLLFLRNKALNVITARAQGTASHLDNVFVEVMSQTRLYAMLALAIYMASLILVLPDNTTTFIRTTLVILLLLQVAVWGNGLVSTLVSREVRRRVDANDQSSTTVNLLGFFARVGLWSVILLLVLDNLPNVNVNTLIASLGISGIAVAFALQQILGDIFSSVSIALDKPFVIGDSIYLDEKIQGTVEKIGLKSTRLRSLSGEQIIISNSDLLNSRIKNYKRMNDRRVEFRLRVDSHAPVETLMRVPALVQEVIMAQDHVRFDRAHFTQIGSYSYDFDIVYTILSPDYQLYKDIQQNINLAVLNRFELEGIPLALM